MFQLPPPKATDKSGFGFTPCHPRLVSSAPHQRPPGTPLFFIARPFAVGEKYHQIFHAPENYQVISLNVWKVSFSEKKSNLNQPSIFKGIFVSWKRGHFLVNHEGKVTYTTNLQGAKALREYGLITTVDCEDELGDLLKYTFRYYMKTVVVDYSIFTSCLYVCLYLWT